MHVTNVVHGTVITKRTPRKIYLQKLLSTIIIVEQVRKGLEEPSVPRKRSRGFNESSRS